MPFSPVGIVLVVMAWFIPEWIFFSSGEANINNLNLYDEENKWMKITYIQ